MTLRRMLAIMAVLSLFFAACGDDGDSSSSGGSSDPANGDIDLDDFDLEDIDLGDIDPEDLEDADDFIDAFVPEGCEFFIDFSIAVSLAIGGQGDLASFKASDAPEEIRDDVQTVLDAIDGADDSSADLGEAFTDPEVEAALDNLDDFASATCDPAG